MTIYTTATKQVIGFLVNDFQFFHVIVSHNYKAVSNTLVSFYVIWGSILCDNLNRFSCRNNGSQSIRMDFL